MTVLSDSFVAMMDDLELPDRDLADAVLAQIDVPAAVPVHHRLIQYLRAASTKGNRTRAVIGIAAIALVISALSVAIGPTRSAIADWFGIGATGIERVPSTDVGTDRSPNPFTTLAESAESLGVLVPEVEANDNPHLQNPIPALGVPDEVYDEPNGIGLGRSYAWRATDSFPELGDSGHGIVLSVRTISGQVDWKSIGADQRVEFVPLTFQATETTGLWIPSSHELTRAGGAVPVRAERVLIWEDLTGSIQYRLETNASLGQNVELTAQIEGGKEHLQAP